MKRDYVDALADSLDLVPIGAWHGNGRKAGWWSPVLVACWDRKTQTFQSVCRVMSGLTDGFYREMRKRYPDPAGVADSTGGSDDGEDDASQWDTPGGLACWSAHAGDSATSGDEGAKPSWVCTDERPAVWFRPAEVWEVRGSELSLSPVHKAAWGCIPGSNRGLSLRFPRLLRVRTDKAVLDATTSTQLAAMYAEHVAKFGATNASPAKHGSRQDDESDDGYL